MATNRPRYMISVDDDMFNEIEDFRFQNRFQTRSEATAALIRLGLDSLNEEQNSTVKAFKAARSDDDKQPGYVDVPKSTIEKLKNAKPTDKI